MLTLNLKFTNTAWPSFPSTSTTSSPFSMLVKCVKLTTNVSAQPNIYIYIEIIVIFILLILVYSWWGIIFPLVKFWHQIAGIAHLRALKKFWVDPSAPSIPYQDYRLGSFPKPVNTSGCYRVKVGLYLYLYFCFVFFCSESEKFYLKVARHFLPQAVVTSIIPWNTFPLFWKNYVKEPFSYISPNCSVDCSLATWNKYFVLFCLFLFAYQGQNG